MKNGQAIIAEVFALYREVKLGFADAAYWETLRLCYERTIDDVLRITGNRRPESVRVLEIGSFCGTVATALRRCGYEVTACDLPLFTNDAALQQHYRDLGIHAVSGNLAEIPLPLAPASYDVVVCCEVIEHLNFNPLHAFCEFNRLLPPDGLLYLGTPNQANIVKRLRLLRGESIHNKVSPDLIWQLNSRAAFSIGLHWREFTAAELAEILELSGFAVIERRFCHMADRRNSPLLRRMLVDFMYRIFPAFLPSQVAIGRKIATRDIAALGAI